MAVTGCPTLQPVLTQAQSFASASAAAFTSAIAQSPACQQCLAGNTAQAQATALSQVSLIFSTFSSHFRWCSLKQTSCLQLQAQAAGINTGAIANAIAASTANGRRMLMISM